MNTHRSTPHTAALRTLALAPLLLCLTATAWGQSLGTSSSYGALGASTVTNTGNTVIQGGIGVSPGSAITGFSAIDGGPGLFTGAANIGNAAAAQARLDANTAYLTLAGLPFGADLTGQDLGGMFLLPGVYHFDTSAQLTGALNLNTLGDPNARFVFQIGTTLTTSSDSMVSLLNVVPGVRCGPDAGIYWQIGSSATLGTYTDFTGSILALASITLNTGATIASGRALALTGAVTLDNNLIDASNLTGGYCIAATDGTGTITAVPEASTYGLIGSGLLAALAWGRRRSLKAARLLRGT